MHIIPVFLLYLGGEPLVFIIGGTVLMLFMNVARGAVIGDRKADRADLFLSEEETSFRKK